MAHVWDSIKGVQQVVWVGVGTGPSVNLALMSIRTVPGRNVSTGGRPHGLGGGRNFARPCASWGVVQNGKSGDAGPHPIIVECSVASRAAGVEGGRGGGRWRR